MSAHEDLSATTYSPVAGAGSLAVMAPAVAAAFAAAIFMPFVPDDLYIYLRMVRSVLGGDGWGFNPGEPVNVASSPVWLAALLGLGALAEIEPRPAQLASGAASVLAVAGAAMLAWRLAGDRRAAWAAGIALAADAWMARWFWSGMEAGLATATAAWALALRTTGRPGGTSDRLSGALLAVAPLVRPELLLLSLASIAATALDRRRGAFARAARDAGLLAAAGAAWAAFALPTWGAILPSTAVAKGTLGSVNISALEALVRVVLVLVSTQAVALALALWLAPRWAAPRARPSEAAPGRRAVTRTILLFGAALAAAYAIQHVRVYTRYLLPLAALLIALGMAAASVRARGLSPRRAAAWRVLPVLLTVALNLYVSTAHVVPKTLAYARSMRTVVIPLAQRLADEVPEDGTIAIPDIGAVGFYSGRRILDLNGLATPEIVPYKREGRLGEYLARHPPDVLVGIETSAGTWLDALPDAGLVVDGVYRFDGMFVRGPDPMVLTVYRYGMRK